MKHIVTLCKKEQEIVIDSFNRFYYMRCLVMGSKIMHLKLYSPKI